MNTKTMGYPLLIFGVFTMVASVVLVILAFTSIIKPSYFNSPLKTSSSGSMNLDTNSKDNSGQIEASVPGLPSLDMIPSGILDNAINLSAHFFLMSFIGGFGYKIAMIGVNLIRPIVVKTSNKTLESATDQT